MEQRMIVAYLDLKGISARTIHTDLVATLWSNAVAYSSVTRHLREARRLPFRTEAPPIEIERMVDDADRAILFALGENPFASMRQLSRLTSLPPTTVYRRLTQSLGCTARHFDGCPMLCQVYKGLIGSIYPRDCWKRSRSSEIGHGTISSLSMSHGAT
jgi:hypothetical protein